MVFCCDKANDLVCFTSPSIKIVQRDELSPVFKAIKILSW